MFGLWWRDGMINFYILFVITIHPYSAAAWYNCIFLFLWRCQSSWQSLSSFSSYYFFTVHNVHNIHKGWVTAYMSTLFRARGRQEMAVRPLEWFWVGGKADDHWQLLVPEPAKVPALVPIWVGGNADDHWQLLAPEPAPEPAPVPAPVPIWVGSNADDHWRYQDQPPFEWEATLMTIDSCWYPKQHQSWHQYQHHSWTSTSTHLSGK